MPQNNLLEYIETSESADERDILERIGRDLWGDRWTIRVRHYADGTTRRFIMHSEGRIGSDDHDFDPDARVLERERIWIDVDDQQMYRDRVHVREETETIEDELLPEESDQRRT
ncbi:hypothetical protein [Natrinema caseinilyticum]|uniref:hypothetical protein n=1 Tax=Natrinema caseinilyticum TaxID=2961570 RepID=UPI0020C4EE5D|nr:hypothetical protein [Natrinema caseinilyticum]